MLYRFFQGVDSTFCHYEVFYVDRTTGLEVLRFQPDPSTNVSSYSRYHLSKHGYNIKEKIEIGAVIITDEEIMSRFVKPCADCPKSYEEYEEYAGKA